MIFVEGVDGEVVLIEFEVFEDVDVVVEVLLFVECCLELEIIGVVELLVGDDLFMWFVFVVCLDDVLMIWFMDDLEE